MENQTIGIISPRTCGTDCDGCTGPEPIDVIRFQRTIRAITVSGRSIVCSLVAGPRRFGELRRLRPGITQHMLREQLRDLAANGIVIRTAFAEIPFRVEYEPSQAGIDLKSTFETLREWSPKYEGQLVAR